MCGVIAVISKTYHKDAISVFKQMLYVGALRGWDGAGLFKVNHMGCIVHKQPGPSSNLLHYLNKPPETSLFGDILVGHNRAATKGQHTIDNTHPFQEKNITLVHNGTIFNHKELKDTEVDSHAICHFLTEHTPQELIDSLFGSYTLIWYDTDTNNLHFMRNSDRPLWIVHTKDLTVLVSEAKMAEWILSRTGIVVNDIEEVTPFTLYTINIKDKHVIKKEQLKERQLTNLVTYKKKEEEEKEEEIKLPKNKKDKILTPKNKGTLAILESLEKRGLKKNDIFTAYCYNSEPIGESYKNWALADFDMQEEVIFYSKYSFEGETVSLIFKNLVDDIDNNSYYIFGTGAQLVVASEKKSLNGVRITEKVHDFLTGRCCSECAKPYTKDTVENAEVFEEKTKDGFVYKYTYVCPTCAK